MDYRSFVSVESRQYAGVVYTIRRMSFERRVELTRKIREIAHKAEYLEAGQDAREKIESALLVTEVDRAYLAWGLAKVEGLEIDGEPATPELLTASGPEEACREALEAIKAECGLSEAERKN